MAADLRVFSTTAATRSIRPERRAVARFSIVTINYAPEPSGFAPHVTALAEHLARHGHQVSVFTGFPFAPEWRRREQDRGRAFAIERDGNLVVHRLTHFIPRRPSSAWQRILMEGSFSAAGFVAVAAAMLKGGRPDAFIYVGAQPALAMLVRVVAALARRPYVVRITDLAARAAVDVGIVGSRFSRILDAFEFAAYTKAAGAAVLCQSFEQTLAEYGYPPDRVRVIANPIDVQKIRPVSRNGRFRARYGIPADAFVVMHAGSMGLKQGLLNVIAGADLTRESAIHWVFVGDGEVRPQLVEATRARGLQNTVHFVPFQPDAAMSETFADADLLLVNQVRAVKDTLIPGKLLTYMAAGRPVLVAANPESQAAQLLRNAGGGVLVEPEDPSALAVAARRLSSSDCATLRSLGELNRAYAEQHFDQEKVLSEQEQFLLLQIR
jgi:colanic acid biosynthesis glycosyl transferase WcaI